MKTNLNQDSTLFDDQKKNNPSSPTWAANIGNTLTTSGKTIARTLALIALAYLAWRGASEFFNTARNISEAIALVVVSALLYIFLVK